MIKKILENGNTLILCEKSGSGDAGRGKNLVNIYVAEIEPETELNRINGKNVKNVLFARETSIYWKTRTSPDYRFIMTEAKSLFDTTL